MSEQNSHRFRPPLYHTKPADGPDKRTAAPTTRSESAKEREGWDAYRRWLTHVSRKPAVPRSSIDHSIYSWKGYQNWADKVRQSWKPEES